MSKNKLILRDKCSKCPEFKCDLYKYSTKEGDFEITTMVTDVRENKLLGVFDGGVNYGNEGCDTRRQLQSLIK